MTTLTEHSGDVDHGLKWTTAGDNVVGVGGSGGCVLGSWH